MVICVFDELFIVLDFLLVDIVVGIFDLVVMFVVVVDDVVLVVCDELVFIIDVYVMVKVFSCDFGVKCLYMVVNMVCNFGEVKVLY